MRSPELGGGHEATRVHRGNRQHGGLAACSAGAAIRTHPGRRCILGLCRCRGSGCEPTEKHSKTIGEARLMDDNIIRKLVSAPKNHAGYHVAAGTGLRAKLECTTWLP